MCKKRTTFAFGPLFAPQIRIPFWTLSKHWVMFIQQIQNICIAFVQRRPNVGSTLYKCVQFVCVYLGSKAVRV